MAYTDGDKYYFGLITRHEDQRWSTFVGQVVCAMVESDISMKVALEYIVETFHQFEYEDEVPKTYKEVREDLLAYNYGNCHKHP